MKNSRTNPVRYSKIIAVEAILLTLAIHFVFVWLFKVPEVKQERTEKTDTGVMLLRFNPDNADSVKIRKYIQQYSPANFSSSANPYGFGSYIVSTPRDLPRLQPLGSNNLKVLLNSHAAKYDKIPDASAALIPLPPRDIGRINPLSSRKINYPFAVGDSGLILQLPLAVDEMRMLNEFALDCGVYKLFNSKSSKMLPRLVLLQSCGRRALDKLSMKLLYQEIKKLSDYPDGEIFTVHYRDHDHIGGDL